MECLQELSSKFFFSVQVQIYLAEENHAASGILRAILKDSDDPSRGPQGIVYLDSDGQVSTTLKLNGKTFMLSVVYLLYC